MCNCYEICTVQHMQHNIGDLLKYDNFEPTVLENELILIFLASEVYTELFIPYKDQKIPYRRRRLRSKTTDERYVSTEDLRMTWG